MTATCCGSKHVLKPSQTCRLLALATKASLHLSLNLPCLLQFKNEEMQQQLNMLLMDKEMQSSHKPPMTLKNQARTASTRRHSTSTAHLLQDIDYNRPYSNGSSKSKEEPPMTRRLYLVPLCCLYMC
eukprot:TRINITY_DN637_c0_g1_i1.p2 TRINITY_DN637_c0_g1~~TRINITY_DN637_c0_g1_i1.p2  ORF type:complete len:127 (+),score=16.31 TRINITY_DN637_c0_g1_i1:464-844(+)